MADERLVSYNINNPLLKNLLRLFYNRHKSMGDSVLFVSEFRDFNPLELQSQHDRYKREEQILRLLTYRKTKCFTCASTVLFHRCEIIDDQPRFPPKASCTIKFYPLASISGVILVFSTE